MYSVLRAGIYSETVRVCAAGRNVGRRHISFQQKQEVQRVIIIYKEKKMKTKLMVIFGLLAIVALCTARPAEEEYEYEEEPAPPPKKVPARGPLVGRRNPLAGKNNKAASSTTTTTAAPQEEEAVAEGDYEEEPQPVETSSTTEAPKKFIKGGIVRPFRSNDDLLATLKRRREQVVNHKPQKPVVSTETKEEVAAEPVQKETKPAASSSTGRRNRFSKSKASNEVPAEEPSTAASAGRTGRGRFNGRR